MNVRIIVIMLVSIMLTTLIGCATVKTAQTKSAPIEVTYELPTLTPVEGSPQDQEKQGVRISVAPYAFSVTRKVESERIRLYTRSLVEELVYRMPENYEIRETPYYEVDPDRVHFKIKVYNNLGHILRLAGTVVAFQIDGITAPLDTASYKDFLEGIVLPRQEMEYVIWGPLTDSMPKSCNIAVLLYDIVTKTDAAGNPTERTSFEWYYTFNKTTVIKSDEVTIRRTK